MATSLGSAVVEVGADTSRLPKDVAAGVRKTSSAVDREARTIGDRFTATLGSTIKRGAQISAAGAIAGIGVTLKKGFNRLAAIEEAEAKLGALGHSAKSVDKIMANALASVENTAFGLGEAASVAASTVAAGVKPGKELEQVLKTVAHSAALAGADMGEMGLIFNKAAASNKVQGEILSELGTRGIPIIQFLAKELKVTSEEVLKMSEKGQIGFKEFERAMRRGVGPAALAMGQTVRGSLANVGAAVGKLGASFLGGGFASAPKVIQEFTQRLKELQPSAEKAGAAVTQGIGKAWDKAVPIAKEFGGIIKNDILPPAREIADVFLENRDSAISLGTVLKSVLTTSLESTGKILTTVADILNAMPEGMQSVVVQGALLALVWPKIAGGAASASASLSVFNTRLKQTYAEMTYATTRAQHMQAGLSRLGSAARNAGGFVGALGLAQGLSSASSEASKTDKAISTLTTTASGAALGFSVGGPWGAAIGGAAGLLGGLWMNTKKVSDTMEQGKVPAANFAASLDQVTGAATKATRELALMRLEEEGSVFAARQLGISSRTLVSAALGQEGALRRVNKAIKEATTQNALMGVEMSTGAALLSGEAQAALDLDGKLSKLASQLREQQTEQRNFAFATGTTKEAIAALAAQFGITKKQARIALKISGADKVQADLEKVNNKLKNTGKTPPSGNWAKSYKKLLTDADSTTKKAAKKVESNVKTGNTKAAAAAKSGGSQIGTELKLGFPQGFSGADALWSTSVSDAVRKAIAAGRNAADSHSPSRKTAALGKDMADGLIVGLAKRTTAVAKQMGLTVTGAIKKGIRSNSIAKNFDKVYDKISDRIDAANKIKDKKRRGIALTNQRDLKKDVQRVERTLLAIQKRYKSATDKLKQMQRERDDAAKNYATSISGQLDFSSLFTTNSAGYSKPVTASAVSSLVSGFAAKAKKFSTLLKDLVKKGIPRALIDQIAGLGIDEGVTVAQAFKSMNASQSSSVKRDWAGVEAATGSAGLALANQFYASGIRSQKKLIAGILSGKKLQSASKKLAKTLGKSLEEEFGASLVKAINKASKTAKTGKSTKKTTVKSKAIKATPKLVGRSAAAMVAPSVEPVTSTPVVTSSASTLGLSDYDIQRLADVVASRTMELNVTVGADNRTKATWYLDGQQWAEALS